jgi:hypothetical protein
MQTIFSHTDGYGVHVETKKSSNYYFKLSSTYNNPKVKNPQSHNCLFDLSLSKEELLIFIKELQTLSEL